MARTTSRAPNIVNVHVVTSSTGWKKKLQLSVVLVCNKPRQDFTLLGLCHKAVLFGTSVKKNTKQRQVVNSTV